MTLAAPQAQTILIVDDEDDIREAIARTLQAYLEDVVVEQAASGPKALEFLETHPVDLILTDYRMPLMTGLEFLAKARAVAPNVPRIMLTAYPDLDLAIRALNEEHILNFITKPIQSETLLQVVSGALTERQIRRDKARALAKALSRMRSAPE